MRLSSANPYLNLAIACSLDSLLRHALQALEKNRILDCNSFEIFPPQLEKLAQPSGLNIGSTLIVYHSVKKMSHNTIMWMSALFVAMEDRAEGKL